MTTRKSILLAPVLVLALMAAACTDNALQAVAKGLTAIDEANHTLITTVSTGNKTGAISDTDAIAIETICARINVASAQASALTRNLATLPAPSKSQILAIMNPIIDAVGVAVQSGTAGIKDQNTKTAVLASLTAIQTTLLTIQAATGGKP